MNTAASGNNAAAIQSLDDRVTAELASKLDSSALAPAIAPLATAAALATTDGQVAAHGSSIAALQSSLTTGLSNKADQSAFDVLEGVVATKSTPDGVDLKLSNYSTTAAMNGSIASANNATLATVAANYGLKTVVDQHSLDIAARITPLEVDTKVANALLGAVTAAALASELASRDASISGLQASKADASALTAYALQSAVDTSSVVDSKIAAALLDAVTAAALNAALLGKADASALASLLSTVDGLDTPLEVDTKIANALLGLATNAALSASETALQSALDGVVLTCGAARGPTRCSRLSSKALGSTSSSQGAESSRSSGPSCAGAGVHLRPGVPVARALGADHPVPLRVKEVGLVQELQDGAARVQRGLHLLLPDPLRHLLLREVCWVPRCPAQLVHRQLVFALVALSRKALAQLGQRCSPPCRERTSFFCPLRSRM